MRYSLEIYSPGSADDVIGALESDHPFPAMSAGDIITPLTVSFADHGLEQKALRIVSLEHISWGLADMKFKTCVFTEAVVDTREERLHLA